MHHDFTGMLPFYPFYIYTSKHQNGMYPDVPRLKHLKAFLARWKPIILIPGWVFLGKIYRKPMAFPMLPLSWRTKTMDFTINAYVVKLWGKSRRNWLVKKPSNKGWPASKLGMVSGSAFTTLPSMGITESIKPPTSVALAEKFIKKTKFTKKYLKKKPGGTITAYGRSGSSYDDNGAAISWWVVHWGRIQKMATVGEANMASW